MITTATRYHDFSCGHRVANHESKCAHLHGHNYRVHFTVDYDKRLDALGRVLDFSVINTLLCQWLEENWDHKFLAWAQDTMMRTVWQAVDDLSPSDASGMLAGSIVWVPFNPTAENMAEHLLTIIGPQQLAGTGCRVARVVVEETRKCSAEASLGLEG